MARSRPAAKTNSSANIGFEQKLWLAADKLRSNMDAAEYKHVVLGLIFLKYISDSFEEQHAKLVATKGADPEDPDEYRAENVFWIPPAARWSYLQNSAKQPSIGKIVDDAMVAIERDNPRLKGVLPKEYARPALDKNRLDELIGAWKTITAIGNVGRRELSRSALRAQQVRVYREMRRFTARAGGDGLLVRTGAGRRSRFFGQTATAASRVRRTDCHFRHHHQTLQGAATNSDVRMQKPRHSSIYFETFEAPPGNATSLGFSFGINGQRKAHSREETGGASCVIHNVEGDLFARGDETAR